MARSAQEKAAAEQRRRQAAAAAAGGALAVDVPSPGEMPPAPARSAAAGRILAALVAFLTDQRARQQGWLRGELAKRAPLTAVEQVIAQEDEFEAEFARRQAERFARDITTALAIPDAGAREGAMRGLVAREQLYARQRAEAMAARAFAAVDRVVLREQSPQGAFWKLDPTVVEHTAGCLLMGGKFWPWAVLDRVHPPRHHGCPCRLIGYGAAVADGLMGAGDVLDVNAAVRRAAHVVMEGALVPSPFDDVEGLLEAAQKAEREDLREALVGMGLASREALDRVMEFDPNEPRVPGGPGGGRWAKTAKVWTVVWGSHAPPGAKRARARQAHWMEGEPRDVLWNRPDWWETHRISIEGVARVEGGAIRVQQPRRTEAGDPESDSLFVDQIRREGVAAGHISAGEAEIASKFEYALFAAPGKSPTYRQVDRWQDSKGGGDSNELAIPVLDRPSHFFVAMHELAHHVLKHKPERKRVGREWVVALSGEKEAEAWRWALQHGQERGVALDDETRKVVRQALASYGVDAETVLPAEPAASGAA